MGAAFASHAEAGVVPARVAIEFNHLYRLLTFAGELRAQHAGRLLHRATGRHQLAAVGDWVAARTPAGQTTATIEAILPRRSKFSRKVAGEAHRRNRSSPPTSTPCSSSWVSTATTTRAGSSATC